MSGSHLILLTLVSVFAVLVIAIATLTTRPATVAIVPQATSTAPASPTATLTFAMVQPENAVPTVYARAEPAPSETPTASATAANSSAETVTPTTPATAAPPTATAVVEPSSTAVPAIPTVEPVAIGATTRLQIPAIGVDAAIEVKSLDPDGAMQAPGAPDVVAWYDFSATPGTSGNAVLAGHLDYAGYGPAVFWRLGDLQPGDVIDVSRPDGTYVQYYVTTVRPFAATDDASVVVASTTNPTITLITCAGTFDRADRAYDERLVVTAELQ